MAEPQALFDELAGVLTGLGPTAVAVSGGVDSVTLAVAAHRLASRSTEMFHAVSPAVPEVATDRVRAVARTEGWKLRIIDADEFSDADYMSNPVDRCFYCKHDLYRTIADHTSSLIVSGTNLDDLADYRPGLAAAEKAGVRHPFVEAGIDKPGIRNLAAHLGLGDLAELPAAPCLSSRVETGLPIRADWLGVIETVERGITGELEPGTVRCRARAGHIAIELDPDSIRQMSKRTRKRLLSSVAGAWSAIGVDLPVTIEPYTMGSAFLRVTS